MVQEQDFGVVVTPDPQSAVWAASASSWLEMPESEPDFADEDTWGSRAAALDLSADARRKFDEDEGEEEADDDLEDDGEEEMYDDEDLDEDFDDDFDDDLDDDVDEEFEEEDEV